MYVYEQLLRSTGYFFKFVSKLKGYDPKRKANEYWIKVAQAEYFSNEIAFLIESANSNANKNIPPLVMNLDLFLDEKKIL